MNVKTAFLISGSVAMLIAAGVLIGATMYPAPTYPAVFSPEPTLIPARPMLPRASPKPGALGLTDPLPPVPTLPPYLPPATPDPNYRLELIPNARDVLTGRKIGIDPRGQQMRQTGEDGLIRGASGVRTGVFAHEINLAVAQRLRSLLQASGATVVMTRESGSLDISDLNRAQILNDAEVALALRIDCGFSDDPNVYGVALVTPRGAAAGTIMARSGVAGELLLQSVKEATGRPLSSISSREENGFNWSNVPICEIVLGYLSNEREDLLLSDATFLDRCAQGLFNGLVGYFE